MTILFVLLYLLSRRIRVCALLFFVRKQIKAFSIPTSEEIGINILNPFDEFFPLYKLKATLKTIYKIFINEGLNISTINSFFNKIREIRNKMSHSEILRNELFINFFSNIKYSEKSLVLKELSKIEKYLLFLKIFPKNKIFEFDEEKFRLLLKTI